MSTPDNSPYEHTEPRKLTDEEKEDVIKSMLETLEKYYPPHELDHIADSTIVEDQEDAIYNLLVDVMIFCKLNGHSYKYLESLAFLQYNKVTEHAEIQDSLG